MEDPHISELDRLGQVAEEARFALQQFDDSGRPDLVEHARLSHEAEQATDAFHRARRARPLGDKIVTWVWDFVRALFHSFLGGGGP